MVRKLFRTHGRHRPDELITALLALSPLELVQNLVKLFTAGELRFARKKRAQTPQQLCARFYAYQKANPRVADWFLTAARSLQREQHRSRYAISALTEQIRWNIKMGIIKTEDGFRISNDLRALYARLVLVRDPSLIGLFTLKPSIADDLLVIDGRSWAEFAKEHQADLWPEREQKSERKPNASVRLQQIKERQV